MVAKNLSTLKEEHLGRAMMLLGPATLLFPPIYVQRCGGESDAFLGAQCLQHLVHLSERIRI